MNAYILSLRYTRTRTHIKHTLFLNHSLLVEYVSCMRLFAFCVFRNFCNNSFTKQRKKHTFSALNILANHLKHRVPCTVLCTHIHTSNNNKLYGHWRQVIYTSFACYYACRYCWLFENKVFYILIGVIICFTACSL